MSRKTTTSTVTIAAATTLVGSALLLVPASASAASAPSGTIDLKHSVSGKTLTYDLQVSGTQSQYADENGKLFSSPEPEGTQIDFGDGSAPAGTDGGAESCRPGTPTNRFWFEGGQQTHTYAKPGTYTVTASSAYCGKGGSTKLTKTYTVVVPGKDAPAPTKPWISTSMPHTMAGRTLRFGLEAHGAQHYFTDGRGTSVPHPEPAGYGVSFGDGSPGLSGQGGGGEWCGTQMLAPFSMGSKGATPLQHTYAKPGTYKINYTVYYCGAGGQQSVTKSYLVTVTSGGTSLPGQTPGQVTPAPGGTDAGSSVPTHSGGPKATPTSGPKVQTDRVSSSHENALVGGASAAALAAAGGIVVARRRRS